MFHTKLGHNISEYPGVSRASVEESGVIINSSYAETVSSAGVIVQKNINGCEKLFVVCWLEL